MRHKQILHQGMQSLKIIKEEAPALQTKEAVQIFKEVCDAAYDEVAQFSDYIRIVKETKDMLIDAIEHNPYLYTALDTIFDEKAALAFYQMPELKQSIDTQYKKVADYLEIKPIEIAKIGDMKIKNNTTICTHSYSTTVRDILLTARVKGKDIRVCNMESRPTMEGRKLATELTSHDIVVHHYVDSAMRLAVKKSDIVLLGCVAIDSNKKCYSAIGSEALCEIAKIHNVPVYLCTSTWKYNKRISQLFDIEFDPTEKNAVWAVAPVRVAIHDYRYEKIDSSLITGIICEHGVLSPEEFFKKIHP